MNGEQARAVAENLGWGEAGHTGGNIWVVVIRGKDRFIIIGNDCLCVYANEAGFDNGEPLATINFC